MLVVWLMITGNFAAGIIASGLMTILQPFSALYVLILAILGPILTKESKNIFIIMNKIFKWQPVSVQTSKAAAKKKHEH